MVATQDSCQESINSRSCSVVEIKLSVFLKGGHLTRSGSRIHLGILFTDTLLLFRQVKIYFCQCMPL